MTVFYKFINTKEREEIIVIDALQKKPIINDNYILI